MFARLLALFLVVPVVELILLVWLGSHIGFWYTVGLIVLTAMIGSWLTHREGLGVWRRFQQRVGQGQLPGRELTDGIIILMSGALLLTPGVLTDVVGILGLLPPTRAAIRAFLTRRMQRTIAGGTVSMFAYRFGGSQQSVSSPEAEPRDDVIDVQFEEFERGRERSR